MKKYQITLNVNDAKVFIVINASTADEAQRKAHEVVKRITITNIKEY